MYQFLASAAFGLEGLVKRDLERLGAGSITPLPAGGVAFSGDLLTGLKANLWLRTADRVLLVVARFPARTFEELFQGVRAAPWPDFLPRDAALPVKAHCARSQLMSPSDCQSIVKKAVVDCLSAHYRLSWLPESGAPHEIDVAIQNDVATVSLNMSGAALSRRGYRTWNGEAPLRETLAAAIVLCSPWRAKLPLYDPCCGTGTILVEAAFIALDRAPGLTRAFDCEAWPLIGPDLAKAARADAQERFDAAKDRPLDVRGSDIDPAALDLAKRHIDQAGLTGRIHLSKLDVRDLILSGPPGVILTNPPYGERLGDRRAAQAVARQLGVLYARSPGWALSVLTGDRSFEKAFARRADKRRRLYNGRLECELMSYLGKGAKP